MDGRRSPVAQVSETYTIVIVAQRHGIAPQELADRLDANRRRTDEALESLRSRKAEGERVTLREFAEALETVPDAELGNEVSELVSLSGWGCWSRTGVVLDGRTDRYHSGDWEELGPHGEARLDLFIYLLAIGIVGSVAPPATTQADHGNDADDRGPPCQRDVPLLTAAPSAPPAQAGRYLSQA